MQVELTEAEIAEEVFDNALGWWEHYHFQEVERIADNFHHGDLDQLRIATVDDSRSNVRVVQLCNGQRFRVTVDRLESATS